MKAIRIFTAMGLAALLTVGAVGCTPAASAPAATDAPAGYRVLSETLAAEQYGIGFRNGDVALGMAVQEALDAMIADGKAAEISQKWFGEDVLLKDQAFIEEPEASADDASLQAVLDKGTLIVGLDDSFPPMGYRDDNNEIVGFDIDLATEVCARLGVELVLQPIDWDAKEMELTSGRIDCIWNGMTITQERIDSMYFAKAYIANEQIVIVPAASDINTLADLAGKTVVLQKGSSALEALSGASVFSSIGTVTELADNVTAYLDLAAGRADAFAVDSVAGYYILATHE